jgi:hypothetical protein
METYSYGLCLCIIDLLLALIYRIYYKCTGTNMNFQAISRSSRNQTMLIQSNQSNTCIHVPRTSLTTSGISGILVDLELTDELDLNNLFIFASFCLSGSNFYCFDPSIARNLSTALHLCVQLGFLGQTYVAYLCVLPTYLALPSALNCADGTLTAVSSS